MGNSAGGRGLAVLTGLCRDVPAQSGMGHSIPVTRAFCFYHLDGFYFAYVQAMEEK